MTAWYITIVTTVDGKSETHRRKAEETEFTSVSALLRYREENAAVELWFSPTETTMQRRGDYSMRLRFVDGETTQGALGFGDSEGEVSVFTHGVSYTVKQGSFLALLRYALIFGEEKQEMSVRITAKEEISEEK